MTFRRTRPMVQVLSVLMEQPAAAWAGVDVLRWTQLTSSTVYPMLARFEERGWLTSTWEDIDPVREGRPRRRLYLMTPVGIQAAGELL